MAAVAAGTLAACGDDSIKTASLVALDGRTGAVLWSRSTAAAILGRPDEEGGRVVMIGQYPIPEACDETFRWIAFDRASGKPVKGPRHRKLPGPPIFSFASVALPGRLDVRSIAPNRLEATRNGGVRWRITLRRGLVASNGYDPGAIPIVGGAGVVVAFPNSDVTDPMQGSPTTELVAIDPHAGTVLWRLSMKTETPPYMVAFPAFDMRTVYVFVARDNLEALDGRTGAVRWRAHVDEGAITLGERILVAGPGRITAFSRAGALLWSTSTPTGSGLEHATVVGDRVYVRAQGYNDSGCGD